jgi:hypothetical protein
MRRSWPCLAPALAALAAACSSSDAVIELTLTGPGEALRMESTLRLAVYGSDLNLADASATLLVEQQHPLHALPLTVPVALPADRHELIDQGYGPVAAEDAGYYLHIEGDVDGDGERCRGDLFPIRESFDTRFFEEKAPERLTIPLMLITNDLGCEVTSRAPNG